ncbi:MAG: TIGR03067 domain-containing protein, partial [Zavarzinella sp.]|nr:TIGR03067 domain-containing protein [Zavarzinella sp.]
MSLATLAAGLADEATAVVPAALIQSTITAGTSAVAARELAEGVIRTMFVAKLVKLSAASVGLAAAITVGAIWLPSAGADPAGGQKGAAKAPAAKEAAPPASDLERIQGTWIVESVDRGDGVKGPKRGRVGEFNGALEGQPMTFDGDRVAFTPFWGAPTFQLQPAREPKGIDFTFHNVATGAFQRKDVTRPSIYRFDGDALNIVLGDDDLKERPDSFDPPARPTPFAHLVLRRPTEEERKGLEQAEQRGLQGTWLGVGKSVRGEPAEATGLKLIVKGDRLRLDTGPGASLHATFAIDAAPRPWHVDLTVSSDDGGAKKGEKVLGIVFRHGELLQLSLGAGGVRPRDFEAAGRAGTVYTFAREASGDLNAWAGFVREREAKPAAPKARAKPENKRLRELQQERVKALEEQLRGQLERVKNGRDPLIQLIEAVRELADAELDLAETREAKLAAVERLVRVLRETEQQLQELQTAGLQTKQGVAQARAARLKAEIQLE